VGEASLVPKSLRMLCCSGFMRNLTNIHAFEAIRSSDGLLRARCQSARMGVTN